MLSGIAISAPSDPGLVVVSGMPPDHYMPRWQGVAALCACVALGLVVSYMPVSQTVALYAPAQALPNTRPASSVALVRHTGGASHSTPGTSDLQVALSAAVGSLQSRTGDESDAQLWSQQQQGVQSWSSILLTLPVVAILGLALIRRRSVAVCPADGAKTVALMGTTGELDQIKQQLLDQGLCSSITGSGSIMSTDRGEIFVKVGTGGSRAGKEILDYEAEGLARMADAAPSLHIPRPWLVDTLSNGGAFIVMDYIKQSGGKPGLQRALGRGLAEMHLAPAAHPTFGFPIDGCCGACPQLNNASQEPLNWVEFWAKYRLGEQLRMLKTRGDPEIQVLCTRLHESATRMHPCLAFL